MSDKNYDATFCAIVTVGINEALQATRKWYIDSGMATYEELQAREAELLKKLEAAESQVWNLQDALACVTRTRNEMQEILTKEVERAEAAEAMNSLQAQSIGMLSKELEAAEARIKASQEQEPCAWAYGVSVGDMYGVTLYKDNPELEPLYAKPPIPPELAELQRENAELRKLLESKEPEVLVKLCDSCGFHQNCPTRNDDGGLCDDYIAQPKEPKQ